MHAADNNNNNNNNNPNVQGAGDERDERTARNGTHEARVPDPCKRATRRAAPSRATPRGTLPAGDDEAAVDGVQGREQVLLDDQRVIQRNRAAEELECGKGRDGTAL